MALERQEALLRVRTVLQLTAISRASIYRLMARGEFPRPVRVGPRAVAWKLSELNQWIATRDRTGG